MQVAQHQLMGSLAAQFKQLTGELQEMDRKAQAARAVHDFTEHDRLRRVEKGLYEERLTYAQALNVQVRICNSDCYVQQPEPPTYDGGSVVAGCLSCDGPDVRMALARIL